MVAPISSPSLTTTFSWVHSIVFVWGFSRVGLDFSGASCWVHSAIKLQSGRPRWTSVMFQLLHLLQHCLLIGHPLIAAAELVFCIIFYRNILNSPGYNEHPCHTPIVVLKKYPALPFSNSELVASSYNGLMTSISQLSMLYSSQRPACQAQSNAFLKTMKLRKSSFWCSKYFSINILVEY